MRSHASYNIIGELPHPHAAHLFNPTLFEIEDEYGTYTIFFGHKKMI